MLARSFFLGALVALGVAACDKGPPEGSTACDNLDESQCLFPFPSDFYRTVSGGSAQLTFPTAAMPVSTANVPIDPAPYLQHDGFSTVTPIIFYLDHATLTGAPTKHDIDTSLTAQSKTILLDATTGELWPHFAEFDYIAALYGAAVINLRIAKPLAFQHRYIVAVQSLVDDSGKTLPATRGFAALRDKGDSPVVGIEERRAHFESDIFPALAQAGVSRDSLQLAWDFTTTSEDSVTRVLLSMRKQLFDTIGADGPAATITSVDEPTTGSIAKIITGIAKVPSFLLPKSADGIKRVMFDANDLPVLTGTIDTEFTLQIPHSIWDATDGRLAAVVQYGHGFLGSKQEAQSGWLQDFANAQGFLILATDMEGMNEEAGVTWVQRMPDDLSTAPLLADWPHQGVINHLALQRMMTGAFLRDTDPRYTRAGVPLYDPKRLYYDGNSQGGTMGNIQISTSIDITRAGLGVPGTAFSYLVHRASQWQTFSAAIQPRYPNTRDFSAIMGLLQIAFDRIEPTYYANHVTVDPFDGAPSHQVILQTGLGDAQVNNDVSQLLARIVGAKLVTPSVRPVWGLDSLAAPFSGQNAYIEFDYGVPLNPADNEPESSDTDTHELTRKNPVAQAQLWHFLETGEIIQTCDGPCDPM
jgi:hypothetical protein